MKQLMKRPQRMSRHEPRITRKQGLDESRSGRLKRPPLTSTAAHYFTTLKISSVSMVNTPDPCRELLSLWWRCIADLQASESGAIYAGATANTSSGPKGHESHMSYGQYFWWAKRTWILYTGSNRGHTILRQNRTHVHPVTWPYTVQNVVCSSQKDGSEGPHVIPK